MQDQSRRVATLLGMARGGGNLLLGEQACLRGVERAQVELVVVAGDAGKSTYKRFHRRCGAAGVSLATWGTKHQLGAATGVTPKAVVGVRERRLARAIQGAIG